MFGKLKAALAAAVAAVGTWVGAAQYYAKQADVAVDKWRTENWAAFNPLCPHRLYPNVAIGPVTQKGTYMNVWDRKAPYDIIVAAYAFNQGFTKEQAADCFIAPVKK